MDEGLNWLEDNIEEAAKGLDLIVSKIFKSLNHPDRISIIRKTSSRPYRFNELKRELNTHATTLSRNISILGRHGLLKINEQGYVASLLGKNMLKNIDEIAENYL